MPHSPTASPRASAATSSAAASFAFAALTPCAFALGAAAGDAPATPDVPGQPEWAATLEIATGRGDRGPWRQNESDYDYVDDGTAAILPDGDVLVAWVDEARKDVFLERHDGTRSSHRPRANVSRSPETFSWLPRLALPEDAPRTVYALWQEIVFTGGSHGGDLWFARSLDGGATFSRPLDLSSRSLGGDGKGRLTREVWDNGSYDLLAGPGGAIHVAWTEYHGALWYSHSTNGGRTFTPPRRIAGDDASPARAPSLALARDGTLHLVWTVGEDAAADVRIASWRPDAAGFAVPVLVARTPGHSDSPDVAVATDGSVHVAFAESATGPFGAARLMYARSTDGARTFERAVELPMPAGAESARDPELVVDADGRLHLAWDSWPDARGRPRGLGYAVAAKGRGFGAPQVVPGSADAEGGTNGSHQGLLGRKLAVRDGSVVLVNSSLRTGERSRVWVLRSRPAP